jgi:16S rRNA U516 pseudouridylate synthase RsuA-like enzyme
MCESVGHKVLRLKRIRIDFLELGDLKTGSFRRLTPAEIERLRNA